MDLLTNEWGKILISGLLTDVFQMTYNLGKLQKNGEKPSYAQYVRTKGIN